jgi:hypothetical protein
MKTIEIHHANFKAKLKPIIITELICYAVRWIALENAEASEATHLSCAKVERTWLPALIRGATTSKFTVPCWTDAQSGPRTEPVKPNAPQRSP